MVWSQWKRSRVARREAKSGRLETCGRRQSYGRRGRWDQTADGGGRKTMPHDKQWPGRPAGTNCDQVLNRGQRGKRRQMTDRDLPVSHLKDHKYVTGLVRPTCNCTPLASRRTMPNGSSLPNELVFGHVGDASPATTLRCGLTLLPGH